MDMQIVHANSSNYPSHMQCMPSEISILKIETLSHENLYMKWSENCQICVITSVNLAFDRVNLQFNCHKMINLFE